MLGRPAVYPAAVDKIMPLAEYFCSAL